MTAMETHYQVIIIGGGPAGLTAGLYASRARLNSLLIEKGLVGGQIANAEMVENYPGFPEGISGYDLGQLIHQQATKYGLNAMLAEVTGLELTGEDKLVNTTEGDFATRAVIIAGGSERSKLGVPGEDEFIGRGVSYCATCDAAFFKEVPVAMVGGGDAAISEALHLAKFSSKVVVIHRRNQLRASRITQERAFAEPRIEFAWDSVVEQIEGEDVVKGVRLRNVLTGDRSNLDVSGVFVAIGLRPNTGYLNGILPLAASGHIITNEKMETEIPGVFAAGDIRQHSAWQAITAAGDGATAAIYADRYLTEQGQP